MTVRAKSPGERLRPYDTLKLSIRALDHDPAVLGLAIQQELVHIDGFLKSRRQRRDALGCDRFQGSNVASGRFTVILTDMAALSFVRLKLAVTGWTALARLNSGMDPTVKEMVLEASWCSPKAQARRTWAHIRFGQRLVIYGGWNSRDQQRGHQQGMRIGVDGVAFVDRKGEGHFGTAFFATVESGPAVASIRPEVLQPCTSIWRVRAL